MDITPYVERLRHDLVQASATGTPEVQQAAERLGLAVDPALRLVLMEALSQATAEITTEMRSGAVELRLNGRELQFVVAQPAVEQPAETAAGPADDEDEADAATARITLRLPESVKARVEELAAKHSQSLNTWIVNALRAATRESAINVDIDLSSLPFGDDFPGGNRRGSRRMTGWL